MIQSRPPRWRTDHGTLPFWAWICENGEWRLGLFTGDNDGQNNGRWVAAGQGDDVQAGLSGTPETRERGQCPKAVNDSQCNRGSKLGAGGG